MKGGEGEGGRSGSLQGPERNYPLFHPLAPFNPKSCGHNNSAGKVTKGFPATDDRKVKGVPDPPTQPLPQLRSGDGDKVDFAQTGLTGAWAATSLLAF